jgi:hypothetical protein
MNNEFLLFRGHLSILRCEGRRWNGTSSRWRRHVAAVPGDSWEIGHTTKIFLCQYSLGDKSFLI